MEIKGLIWRLAEAGGEIIVRDAGESNGVPDLTHGVALKAINECHESFIAVPEGCSLSESESEQRSYINVCELLRDQ
ncbi:hypothetical protein NDS46_27455 [Paenibacillus thiaminolyticus]|uniref:hypothetical protein n=1 Tax=Paenibacillus thiaminolyticus TaxID=49283 RepID=UPI00232BAA4F|nr:hypothetical protein [Paenibacillus thiaminolyticus]WCF07953.1 hypothetical protein NDS46_27455 [Paenibacillus thiaminolyticus]